MKDFAPPWVRPATWFIAALILSACSLGRMNVQETHYYAIPNGKDTNYYRLRVEAKTVLGVAGYRSGWYPARAVDRLFGEAASDSSPAELQARTELEMRTIEAIKETQRKWLEAAQNPDTPEPRLRLLNEARRRVLAYPSFKPEPFPGTVEIEYNPGRDLVTFHIDDKLLFVLSSDPDAVVRAIANFVEEDKTVLTIQRLSGTITQGALNEVAGREAALKVDQANDARVRQVLQQTREGTAAGTKKEIAVFRIDVLLSVIDAVFP